MQELIFSPSDFVAVLNQTLEYTYPAVSVVGELTNLRISKNKWVYFDLKDEFASVKFFGTVYQLPGPLEDGLMIQVLGSPRLHPLYGFSLNVINMRAVGEGSLKRAAALLEAKLRAEGLFDEARKRPLPYPPKSIGLITSKESAAYADFIKILGERWAGVEVRLYDVQVQGDQAPLQIVEAIEYFNKHAEPVEVLAIMRGGGSADDLAAFSTEQVTRAIASSRLPTLAAVGHEIDISLAELAADRRASTPSNAAQLLVPDKSDVLQIIKSQRLEIKRLAKDRILSQKQLHQNYNQELLAGITSVIEGTMRSVEYYQKLLKALNPKLALERGFVILRQQGVLVKSGRQLKQGNQIDLELVDSFIKAQLENVRLKAKS